MLVEAADETQDSHTSTKTSTKKQPITFMGTYGIFKVVLHLTFLASLTNPPANTGDPTMPFDSFFSFNST